MVFGEMLVLVAPKLLNWFSMRILYVLERESDSFPIIQSYELEKVTDFLDEYPGKVFSYDVDDNDSISNKQEINV